MKTFLTQALMVLALILVPAVSSAQDGSYRLKKGDVLRIEVLEDSTLNRNALILPDGTINFPLAGSVRAAGTTVGQLEDQLTRALAPNFANAPNVFVSVSTLVADEAAMDEKISVYVLGEVNAPGLKEVEAGTTALQLLAESGGFTRFAATKRLQLRRKGDGGAADRVFQIDYRAISRGAADVTDPALRDGDVLLVPERRLFE